MSEGRQGESLAPSHLFHLCRELTEINRRHITESVNSIRRVSEPHLSSWLGATLLSRRLLMPLSRDCTNILVPASYPTPLVSLGALTPPP